MSTRVCVINRIVIAIAIQVQAVGGFGVQVGGIIGRDKSAPFGGIIPSVAVIEAGVIVVVITAITNGVGLAYILPVFPLSVNKKLRLTRNCRPARFVRRLSSSGTVLFALIISLHLHMFIDFAYETFQ